MSLDIHFLSYFEIVLYNLQHNIAFLLTETVSSFQFSTLLLFFSAGILTIFNPCFISVIPLSISYLNSYKQKIYKNAFVTGLVTSIVVVILVINFFSYNYFLYFARIPLLSLIILIALSLNLLQILNFSYYLRISDINVKSIFNKSDLFQSALIQCYLIGFVIGFTTVPCSSPIFTVIHFWLYNSETIFFLLIYLTVYFIGCVLPLLSIFYIFINYLQIYAIAFISNLIIPLLGFFTLASSLFFLLEKILL